MERGDKILLGALGCASAAISVSTLFHGFQDFWRHFLGATSAAWVQAIGVFVAVYWAGRLSRKQAGDTERARIKRQVASTSAVIAKSLWAADNVESGLQLPAAGLLARNPISVLVICDEALTPMRINVTAKSRGTISAFAPGGMAPVIFAGSGLWIAHRPGEKVGKACRGSWERILRTNSPSNAI